MFKIFTFYTTDCEVTLDEVEGKCYVVYADDLTMSVDEYSRLGPDRFYFREVSSGDSFLSSLLSQKYINSILFAVMHSGQYWQPKTQKLH